MPARIAVWLSLMLIGLLWIVVYYVAGDQIPFMVSLSAWNFAIGFGAMVAGLAAAFGIEGRLVQHHRDLGTNRRALHQLAVHHQGRHPRLAVLCRHRHAIDDGFGHARRVHQHLFDL